MSRRDTPLSRRLRGVAEGVRRRGERFAAALSHTFSRENMAALFSARSFKEGGISAMSCVLVLGIAAGAVALVEALPSTYTAIDISRDQTTSISDDTAEYLSGLDCDVEVYLIAEEGSEDEYVERMLDQYAQASDRVTVEQVDPALHPTFTDQYTSEDVADGSIIVVVDDASRVVSSSDLYKLNYSTFSYEFAGESAITSAIIALTSEDLPVVYVHHRRIPLLPAAGDQFVRNHLRPLGRQRLRALPARPRHHRDRLVQKHARHPEPAGDLEQRLREDRYRELRHPGAGRRRRRRADGGRHGRLRGGRRRPDARRVVQHRAIPGR